MDIWESISVVFTVRKATLEGSVMLVVIVATIMRSLAMIVSTTLGSKYLSFLGVLKVSLQASQG